ncbi:hypothetical protein HYH03_010523 [Edaphochlamys debaryana]|uniref:Uncharacterized protein n=1 Tax=Edaphochlamys debaryana TaxID=47281 RepID=A0A835XXY9_9CHLO|nr:hypothetical protein HYH03_010523 [Edaphochlamys debaryana]|eukprot:KAG2491078.1 hypothetical protein HYH03_010523 [Edaphochlamys debaryana]
MEKLGQEQAQAQADLIRQQALFRQQQAQISQQQAQALEVALQLNENVRLNARQDSRQQVGAEDAMARAVEGETQAQLDQVDGKMDVMLGMMQRSLQHQHANAAVAPLSPLAVKDMVAQALRELLGDRLEELGRLGDGGELVERGKHARELTREQAAGEVYDLDQHRKLEPGRDAVDPQAPAPNAPNAAGAVQVRRRLKPIKKAAAAAAADKVNEEAEDEMKVVEDEDDDDDVELVLVKAPPPCPRLPPAAPVPAQQQPTAATVSP